MTEERTSSETHLSTQAATPTMVSVNRSLVLAAMPFLAYAVAFCFDAGYVGWFGVPYWLIRPDLSSVLTVASVLAILLLTAYSYTRFIPALPWSVVFLIWLPPVLCVLCAAALLLTASWSLSWSVVKPIVGTLLMMFGAFVFVRDGWIKPIRTYTDTADWIERWRRGIGVLYASADYTVAQKIASGSQRVMGRGPSLAVALFALGMIGLFLLGRQQASNEKEFYLATKHGPCVAVRRYAEGIVCADVDTASRRLLGRFRIMPFADDAAEFQSVLLGPLKPSSLVAGTTR